MKKINLSDILAIGNYWEKGDNKRTYLIDPAELLELAGWELRLYKSGSIKEAHAPDGDKVSNSRTARIQSSLAGMYYDHAKCVFVGYYGKITLEALGEELMVEIVDDVNVKVEEKAEEQAAPVKAEEQAAPIEAAAEAAPAEAAPAEAAPAPAAAEVEPEAKTEEKEGKWRRIAVNIQNIQHETEKAVLIAMPHSSKYDGFKFWFPKKLVREGFHSYERAVSVADDMSITLKRKSEKTGAVLAERTVDADELIEAFGAFCGVTETERRKIERRLDKVETVRHTPAPLEATKVEADATLVR